MPFDIINTEVLTKSGWKYATELTLDDEFATMNNEKLSYEKAKDIEFDSNYIGEMYTIRNQAIDLYVTGNHRMWVSKIFGRKREWLPYKFLIAREIVGRYMKYKKDAIWLKSPFQFILPAYGENEAKEVYMDSFLVVFGVWITVGRVYSNVIEIPIKKPKSQKALLLAIQKLGYDSYINGDNILIIYNRQLAEYLKEFDNEPPERYLPEWILELSQNQCRVLLTAMLLHHMCKQEAGGCEFYYTNSIKLANQFQQLLLHAGWSGMLTPHVIAGNDIVEKDKVIQKYDLLRVSVVTKRLNPSVNHDHSKDYEVSTERLEDLVRCEVFSVKLSSDMVYIRRNGKTVWIGC